MDDMKNNIEVIINNKIKEKELRIKAINNNICPICGENIKRIEEKKDMGNYTKKKYGFFGKLIIIHKGYEYNYFDQCTKNKIHYNEEWIDDFDDFN